jgi:hypothetical protein
MRKICVLLSLILLLAAVSSLANAGEIDYIYQGTGAGHLGNSYFENATFTITLTGDTNNVQDRGNGLFVNVVSSAQISIQGLNTADFLIPIQVFDNQSVSVGGFSRAPDSADLIDLVDPAFANYDLKTAFGPVFIPYPLFGQFNCEWVCVSTTQGDLDFVSMTDLTFSAAPVPEPSTLVLLGAGVVGLAGRLRRSF